MYTPAFLKKLNELKKKISAVVVIVIQNMLHRVLQKSNYQTEVYRVISGVHIENLGKSMESLRNSSYLLI